MSLADINKHLSRFVVEPRSTRVTWNVWELQVTSIIARYPEPRYDFSNHSGKRTCVTSLFHEGFDEQIISSRTRHRSTAKREYKVGLPSHEQQFELSKIFDPPTANMVSTMTLHDTDGDSDEQKYHAKIPYTYRPAANVSTNLISQINLRGVPGFTTIIRNVPEL